MPFTPTDTLLTSTFELKSFNHYITFVDEFNVELPVTITPVTNNSTVIVSGNRIYGKFTDVYPKVIDYRTVDDGFVEVGQFSHINNKELYGIYYYQPDTRTSQTFEYVATANNGNTQTYTIIVENSFTRGRNELLIALGKALPVSTGFRWINHDAEVVIWVNEDGQTVIWDGRVSGDGGFEWIDENSEIIIWINELAETITWIQ